MDENVKKNYEYWCTSPIFDDATKSELKSLEGNEDEIFDRFYRELEFGTGGLRGVIGAGTNRMNFYTVGKATQGLANFINKQGAAAKGVAIAFDSRRMSPEFADTAACVLAANGIKAYIFDSLRPTPELSFALRTLGRDFPDNQIIIASIYHYVPNEHVITLEEQLLDQIIVVN